MGGDFWTCDCWRGCAGKHRTFGCQPWHYVSIRDETNIKLTVFYLRHQSRISKIVAPASVALTVVRSLLSAEEYEENFKVIAEQPVINEKYWPRTMEATRDLFGSVLGGMGCRWLTSSVRVLRYLLGQIPQKGT
jgi:hypothetical protein